MSLGVQGTGGNEPVYDPYNLNVVRKTGNEMDRNAFMNLLITQLQHQDPLNPMEDREFIAQMAQFSSLEQMQQVNQSLESLTIGFAGNVATGYLGRTVTAQTPDDDEPFTGVVNAIKFVDGMPKMVIGEREIDPGWVLSVK